MTQTHTPPSPRLCLRIIEAHHLHCQALTHQQIADRMGCARSTVSAYLRDFHRHRDHILHTVAGDQLLDQVYQLAQPDADPDQHRQRIAAARELRLLLRDLPQLEQHEQQRREQIEAARNAPAIALARSRHFMADLDGHVRYSVGNRDCTPECPMCHPDLYEGEDAMPPLTYDYIYGPQTPKPKPTKPEPTEPDPVQPEPTSADDFHPEPDEIQQDLTKSDIPQPQFPVPDDEFDDPYPPNPQFPPPRERVGPDFPFDFHTNPGGYIPRDALTVRYDGETITTTRGSRLR